MLMLLTKVLHNNDYNQLRMFDQNPTLTQQNTSSHLQGTWPLTGHDTD